MALVSLASLLTLPARAVNTDQLMQLLAQGSCPNCKLQDADLVHANLRDANLSGAQLQRANLSGAQLDGAQLKGADLSFTSLQGASLRGADLRGARLEGTDLRASDLSGAQLDDNGLAQSHWQGATGIDPSRQSYADLHNAGVMAATNGRYQEAETFFGEAIRKIPEAAISWTARGITRAEQGKTQLAAQDFSYASILYQQTGEEDKAKQLQSLAKKINDSPNGSKGGNGLGSQLMQGAMTAFQAIAPLAIKVLSSSF